MPIRFRRFNQWLLILFSTCAAVAPTINAQDSEPASPTEIRRLTRAYNAARRDRQQQKEVVSEAVKIGAAATSKLQVAIERDLFTELIRYTALFRTTTARLSQSRAASINVVELGTLRNSFHQTRQIPNLSKEMIQQQSDPIIERLESLLVIQRSDILAAEKRLSSEREKLSEIGRLWEQCAVVNFEGFVSTIDDLEIRSQLEPPSFHKYLEGEEQIAARLAIPMPDQARQILGSNARVANRIQRDEARAILATNLMRIMVGQSPLKIDLRLVETARDHSKDMKENNFFSHDSPIPGKNTPWSRAKNFGTSASGENIAINGGGGADVVRAWHHSPGHHKNMFGNHQRIGVGKSGRYWTQMFGN